MRRLGWLVAAWLITHAVAQDWISERLQGRGVVGPYTLSWNQIVERSEIVLVGERLLLRERDYWIDYASGTIRFAQPLRREMSARVGYRIVPGRSQKNAAPDVVFQTEMARLGAASLSVQGRLRDQQGVMQTELGIRAAWQTEQAQTDALYLVRESPDRRMPSLVRVSSQWRSPDGFDLRLLFARAEPAFGDARAYGVVSGQEQASAQFEWRPDRALRTRIHWLQQRPLQNPLTTSQQWGAGLEYTLPTFSLQLERQMSETSQQPLNLTDRVALSLQPHEQIRVRVEEKTIQQGEQTRVQTEVRTEVGSAVQLSHQTTQEGSTRAEQSRVAFQGGTGSLQGRVELSQYWQQDDALGAAQIQLQAKPHPNLQLSGEYQIQEQAGQMRGYYLQLNPLRGMQLRLSERAYEGWLGLNLRSQQLEWEWRMPFALTLGAQLARHPLQQGRPQPTQLEAYRLRWQTGRLALEAGYSKQEPIAQPLTERRYTLSLQSQLNPATLFALTFQQTEWQRDAFLREVALKLGLTQRLSDFYLTLEASAHLPRADQSADPNRLRYSGSLKLGVQF